MDVERAREDVVEAGLCVEDGIEVKVVRGVGYKQRVHGHAFCHSHSDLDVIVTFPTPI
jgi:hypothetical protein